MLGYSAVLSLDDLARRWLGERGALEAALSIRHENGHFTDSTEGDEPRYQDMPHIGDFLMAEAAARIPLSNVDCEVRLQYKHFVAKDYAPFYSRGAGADVIFRWRLNGKLQPFSSTFYEYIFGNEVRWNEKHGKIPDARFFRNLWGVIIPGKAGDLQVFSSFDLGHGKGLWVFHEELRWGAGVRLAFF